MEQDTCPWGDMKKVSLEGTGLRMPGQEAKPIAESPSQELSWEGQKRDGEEEGGLGGREGFPKTGRESAGVALVACC